jgi:hypothetical protein
MVNLVIDGRGTFELLDGDCPRSGDVLYGTGHAYLKPLAAYGRSIHMLGSNAQRFATEVELTPHKDGTIELRDPACFDSSPVTLTRDVKPDAASQRTN